jgi:hypothetical protein
MVDVNHYKPSMEDPLMSKHRVMVLVAAVVLIVFCLVPNLHAADSDGVMMHDGKMMMMKGGKASGPMEKDMTMSNGTTVMSDGTVKTKDGGETHMKEGQIMMMDGHMMDGGNSSMMGGGSTSGMNH